MATDKQQTPRPADQPAPAPSSDQNAPTQVGQVIQGLERLTRRLPTTRPRRPRTHPRGGPAPSRERLAGLLEALGDPQHPDHAEAVEALVEIGAPAVPLLCDALNPQRSWLTAYRAAEALGRIGDGRAAGALIQALQHPNSNVRWNAVRALSQVGDVRALLELRRVAQEDHGRTSWGESVAGAAQSTLDQIQARSIWGQGLELVKTAITSVLMILALILAFSVVTTLRSEITSVGRLAPGQTLPNAVTVLPTVQPAAQLATPLPAATTPPLVPTTAAAPIEGSTVITGTVLQTSNVRPFPNTNNLPIGQLRAGDEVVFVARTADGQWYRVRMGDRRNDASTINNPDGSGTGWINQTLLTPPNSVVPVEEVVLPTVVPATPTP